MVEGVRRCLLAVCGAFLFAACANNPASPQAQLVAVDSTIMPDRITDSIIGIYRKDIEAHMSKIIGEAEHTLEANRPESGLTRFIADMLLASTREFAERRNLPMPQMALCNVGGIRNVLNSGKITVGDVFEVAPFENSLVIVVLDGRRLTETLRHIALRGGEAVAGASLSMRGNQLVAAAIGGEPIDTTANYAIATIDYLANGGDNFAMLTHGEIYETGILVRDMLIERIEAMTKEGMKIVEPTDQRITAE